MKFERNRGDVCVGKYVVGRRLRDASRKSTVIASASSAIAFDWHEVHEVEHAAEIHRKAFLALTDEHAARHVAARNVDRVLERVGVRLVRRDAAEGLGADEVIRLAEHGAAVGPGNCCCRAVATIAANQRELIAFLEIERRRVGGGHDAHVLERHRDLRAAHV